MFLFYFVWSRRKEKKLIQDNQKLQHLQDEIMIQQVQIDHLQLYKNVVQASPDLFLVVDQSLQVMVANKTAAEYNWKAGQPFMDSHASRDSKLHMEVDLKRVIKEGSTIEQEVHITSTQHNHLKIFTYHIFPVKDEHGVVTGAILAGPDVTAQRNAEQELNRKSRLATLGETAGGIAHEINNPLNVVVGVAELMKEKIRDEGSIEPAQLEEYCDRLIKYSMKMAHIIKSLSLASRDASQDPFENVSLNAILEETLELCEQGFRKRGIRLNIRRPEATIWVEGRAAQLSQIVMNLLNNAKDAVENLKSPEVVIELTYRDKLALFRVWDSGSGVSSDLEGKIMQAFFTTKAAGKGTGLGLSISKTIAHDHRGQLLLNREIAKSCFELQLPVFKLQEKKSA